MELYRFFIVNERDGVTSNDEIHCENDYCARAVAEDRVTDRLGVEVWDVGRRVCKLPARAREQMNGTNARP